VFTQPPVNDVGVDAVPQRDGGNGCAWLTALPNHLEFELWTVKPPLEDFGASTIFIVHTISRIQMQLNMTSPAAYAKSAALRFHTATSQKSFESEFCASSLLLPKYLVH
jgi:hypothetical protein